MSESSRDFAQRMKAAGLEVNSARSTRALIVEAFGETDGAEIFERAYQVIVGLQKVCAKYGPDIGIRMAKAIMGNMHDFTLRHELEATTRLMGLGVYLNAMKRTFDVALG